MISTTKNILLTGTPSSGKRTVVKNIVELLKIPANGFYTEEELLDNKRVGFMIHTLDGKHGYLAHQDIESDYRLRRFGVSIDNIQDIAIPSILPIDNQIIIIDEIGKKECFSENFISATRDALDSSNIVIGTITYGRHGFIQEIKERNDITIIEVTLENRDTIPIEIIKSVKQATFYTD